MTSSNTSSVSNIDAIYDPAKSFDVQLQPGVPIKDYLLFIFSRNNEPEEDTIKRIKSWPSYHNASKEIKDALS